MARSSLEECDLQNRQGGVMDQQAFANVGAAVDITVIGNFANAPAPAGGAIEDGTYVLTRRDIYASGGFGCPGRRRETIVIAGGTIESIAHEDNDCCPEPGRIPDRRSTASFTTSGSTIHSRRTCPARLDLERGFSATPTTLQFFESEGGLVEVRTFTRR